MRSSLTVSLWRPLARRERMTAGDVAEELGFERASGYALSRSDLAFYGLCPNCRAAR